MNRLLIVGAGGHGKVVKEVAESTHRFSKIDFIDDQDPTAIGKIEDLAMFSKDYAYCFVGIGNNHRRRELIAVIRALDYTIPILVHPTAYVSPSAYLMTGVVVEPMAIVNANSVIKQGGIISVGAIVDHDVVVHECAHVNAGVICKAGSNIEAERKLEAGEVILGYPSSK